MPSQTRTSLGSDTSTLLKPTEKLSSEFSGGSNKVTCQKMDRRSSSGSSSNASESNSFQNASSLGINSNADYDHLRNTTLMFFLDRLFMSSKDGVEVRTLHDLSCLFGTKGFTKEMRQIVGASRNGLKNFLQSYPSLFTIEGDKVYLTQLKQAQGSGTSRDYNQEAVEYFSQKLQQFGNSLVPIRNLFGYRSQASQEVRHVSGKNSKQFKQFLSAHDRVFHILADEHVILKSSFQELEARGESLALASLQQHLEEQNNQELQQPALMDSYLNKQFGYLIEACMKRMMEEANASESRADSDTIQTSQKALEISLPMLHARILRDCNNPLFLKIIQTLDDLRVFLRMHPKLFKRYQRENGSTVEEAASSVDHNSESAETPETNSKNQEELELVRLVTEEERKEMERLAYPTAPQPSLKRCDTQESNMSSQEASCASLPANLVVGHEPPIQVSSESTEHQPNAHQATEPTVKANSSISQRSKPPQRNVASGGSALRATAPPFVPSSQIQLANAMHSPNSRLMRQSVSSVQSQVLPGLQRSISNLAASNQGSQRANMDSRLALRSYLIKANASNTNNSLYSPSKLSNGAQQPQQQQFPIKTQRIQESIAQVATGGDDLRARTVNIVREASNIICRVMSSTDAVAFDCKGYNLGFNGQITLIQFAFLPTTNSKLEIVAKNNNNNSIGSQKPEVCIFDLITNPELAYCLKPLLESEQIVKVVHDVRNKSNALYNQFGIMLNNVFDTQVANLVIQQQETGKPAYKSRYISMSKLCEVYGDETLMKYRNSMKSKTRHAGSFQSNNSHSNSKLKDVNYWRTRPLTDAMIYESTMDTYSLVGGVYRNLRSKIKPEYEPLFQELNLEGVLARIKPEEIRSVKKERKIDLEVIDLKRKLYSDSTRPIVLSNREIRLLRHIDLTEEVRQKIQQCKKVAKKLERLDTKAAQNSQLFKSLNSQTSSDLESGTNYGDASLVSVQSMDATGSQLSNAGSSSVTFNGYKRTQQIPKDSAVNLRGSQEKLATAEMAEKELSESGMTNLMDGSMFDELKNKMIESSSLLESLADDDDEKVVVASEQLKLSLHHHEGNSDSHDCNCHCHHSKNCSSTDEDRANLSLKSASSKSTDPDEPDASIESASKSVDMAVQCDLLN